MDHRLEWLAGMFAAWLAADNQRDHPNAQDKRVGRAMAEAAWHEAQVARAEQEGK